MGEARPRLIAALLRHGDYRQLAGTPSAHQPFPLTAKGEAQARGAVPILREMAQRHGCPIDPVVDASRLLRGWQTARLICAGLGEGFRVESFDALAERGLGSAANLTLAQIEAVLEEDPRYPAPPPGWKADSHYCLPLQGAESLMQAGRRVADHLRERMAALAEGARENRLKLFVGHGAAFRHAAHHLGLLGLEQIAQLSMHHCQPLCIEWLGDDRWRQVDGEWKRRALGEAALD